VPILRARELSLILEETAPRAIVVPGRYRDTDYVARVAEASASLSEPPRVVVARPTSPATPGTIALSHLMTSDAERRRVVEPSSLAVTIYTSGSTAQPKGAMHSHDTLCAELHSLTRVHALGPRDRVLMPSPLTHVSGVIHGILAPALLGTSAVLLDRWDPGQALAAIERYHVTYMVGAPTFLQEMLAHLDVTRRDLSSLRLFSCGGASVPPELMRQGRRLLPGLVTKRVYGSSEFPTISTTDALDAETHGLDTEGRPLPGVELRICEGSGRPCEADEEGEIRARGPDCFLGYVDATLDADTFDGEGFLCTGDLGVLDRNGYLRVTGRVKDIIVRKGEKISAREVEDIIATHPDVAEVALIPIPDAATGERACACIRTARGTLTLEALLAFLRERDLTPQKLPEQLVILDDFPRTPSGKIHKRELRERILRGAP
jgi:cyclohexanecarboxylate-CoA ligase